VFVLRRGLDDRGKLRSVITVDEARGLRGFFSLSAADGGRRVVVVDAADEMNPNAANAILKLLEEPPAGAHLLLVAHQPARLLPTVRSRCRVLRFASLGSADMGRALGSIGLETPDPAGLAALSEGSVGEAARLTGLGGLEAYADLVACLGTLPRLDRARAVALAEGARGPLLVDLLGTLLARLARAGLGPVAEAAPGEGALLARLAPDARAARLWAGLHAETLARARAGLAVNLDPAALLLDMLLAIEEAARAAS
jgi:DNA polymerase-3 subunit delta'